MGIYGPEFAGVYAEHWHWWTEKRWPWLLGTVQSRAPQASTWLDLCCGCGELLRHATEAGYEALGLDASIHQLEHAKPDAPAAELICGDIRDLALNRRFDVITCLFDSLNYLTDPADVASTICRTAEHLSACGVLIFDVNTRAGLEERWNNVGVIRSADHLLVTDSSFDATTGLARSEITGFVRHGDLWRRFDEEHVQRGYGVAELGPMLDAAGLSYEALDGGPGRLFFICRQAT